MKKFLLSTGLLIATAPVYANVVYNFTSSPVIVNYTEGANSEVFDSAGSGLPGQAPVGTILNASLTFAAALTPNSTTTVSAESGGYDFIRTPTQGGLVAYYAPGPSTLSITNDINEYVSGSGGNTLSLFRYSSIEGSVTTDALGNISVWNLTYTLFDNPFGSGFLIDTLTNTIDTNPGITDALFQISSNPAIAHTINNVVALNGVANNNPYNFNGADTAFADPGAPQLRSYTSQPGTWQRVNVISAPGPLMLLLGTLLLNFGYFVRRS